MDSKCNAVWPSAEPLVWSLDGRPWIPEQSEFQISDFEIFDVFDDDFDAGFFVDGVYDFKNNNWTSGGEIIENSEWMKTENIAYPILLDRMAFVKVLNSLQTNKMGPLGQHKIPTVRQNFAQDNIMPIKNTISKLISFLRIRAFCAVFNENLEILFGTKRWMENVLLLGSIVPMIKRKGINI